jgi:hypothetical protein
MLLLTRVSVELEPFRSTVSVELVRFRSSTASVVPVPCRFSTVSAELEPYR